MALSFPERLLVGLINLVSKTWRIKISGNYTASPSIIIFWHGFMLPVWKHFSGKNPFAVVSQSHDGEILTSLLKKWGFSVFRGSSASGGSKLINDIIAEYDNSYLLMTPDGAKGPVYQMKPGALVISQRTGHPVIICAVKIHSALRFKKSWDNFAVPYPFSSIELNFSEPFIVPSNYSRQEVTEMLTKTEEKMNKMYEL